MAKNLTYFRKARGETQATIAKNTGLSQSKISRVEGGTEYLRADQAVKVARFLECTVEDLVGDVELPEPDPNRKRVLRLLRQLPPDQLKHWLETGDLLMPHVNSRPISPEKPKGRPRRKN